MSRMCKRILNLSFNQAVTDKISNFHKIATNSTYINRNFSSIFATFQINCFIPLSFMAGTCEEYSLFIFASCEPLRNIVNGSAGNGKTTLAMYDICDMAPQNERKVAFTGAEIKALLYS